MQLNWKHYAIQKHITVHIEIEILLYNTGNIETCLFREVASAMHTNVFPPWTAQIGVRYGLRGIFPTAANNRRLHVRDLRPSTS